MKIALVVCLALSSLLPVGALALTSGPADADTAAAGSSPSAIGATVDRRVWRGTPIRVDLPLNREQIIRFPGTNQLRSGLLGGPVPGLRVQVLDGHLYLLAKEPFAATRMIVQTSNGSAVLLDLAADKGFAVTGPLAILTATGAGAGSTDTSGDDGRHSSAMAEQDRPDAVGYVALVRHAAQSLYAPPRLIPRTGAILQSPLPDRGPVALVRGARVVATPVASWRAEGSRSALWVTAVKLRNVLDHPVVLDPRGLRGRWRAASFQHARLGAAGDETDTTTVYLISDRRFAKAMAPWQAAHQEVSAP